MKALLLAAGFGSRLKPVTDNLPKCLVPIGGVPLLEIWIEKLVANGINHILVNSHYLPTCVESYLRDSQFKDFVEIRHEECLLGTAGSLRFYSEWFDGHDAFVAHADNLTDFAFSDFKDAYTSRPDGFLGTMMLFDCDDPSSCGIVATGKDGNILQYWEKDPEAIGAKANAAVYIFSPEFFSVLEALQGSDLSADIVPKIYSRLNTFFNKNYHRDIGNIQAYAIAQVEFEQYLRKNEA